MRKTVLILGASGRFGRHAAEAFWNAGWEVRAFDRCKDDLMRAADGADIIVSAWNPPYPDWAAHLPGLHARVQQAAKASGATVILPGNVYVFGARTPPPWGVDSPRQAQNLLGRLRIELEQGYRASGVRTILLRAGDFMDTECAGNWLERVILKPLHKGRIDYPGRLDAPHAWAYLPDLAQAAVQLATRKDDLARFEEVPFPGYTLTGSDLALHLSGALGQPITARRMPWWPLRLASPVWPMGRCLLEMRYLWDTPHWLDGERFRALCPDFRATPPDEALAHAAAAVLAAQRKARPCQGRIRSTQTIR